MSTDYGHAWWQAEREHPASLDGIDCVVIRDTGHVYGCPTITNDAEDVVRAISKHGLMVGKRLFYYDSEGQLDELLHDGRGGFLGFAPGPGRGA